MPAVPDLLSAIDVRPGILPASLALTKMTVTPFRLLLLLCCTVLGLPAATPPGPGDPAPDFRLPDLAGPTVTLGELTGKGPVVLVVLRGWPGYQCPVCDGQVNDFIGARKQFAAAGARVVFVYPGPAAELTAHAAEFRAWKGREWPQEYPFLLDSDYAFTQAYGLRWEADHETAYPSTFIIDGRGKVRFAKVSRSHGGRTKAAEILNTLRELPASP